MFIQTTAAVFNAIFHLLMISLFAGILIRKNLVSASQVKALSAVTVNIFLPCLITAKTLMTFRPGELETWWIMPLAGGIIVVIGLVFSSLLFRMNPEKRPMMTLASMQNGIYIVLPIGQAVFPDQFDRFALYCFLLLLGLNPIMWSLGKVMLSGKLEAGIHWRDFLTPPLAAVFISVAAVYTKISLIIPGQVIASMDLLGQATVPVAVFVMGATIGSISLKKWPPAGDILIVTMVKFILVPGTVFAILYFGGFSHSMPLFCAMAMVQASSPPATNLVLIVRNYGGDTQSVSTMMLVQYLACIFFMPVWIAAWQFVVV